MMDEKLKRLKKEYMNTPIPKELDDVVHDTLRSKQKKPKRPNPNWFIGLAAAVMLFVLTINTSPVIAGNLAKIPVVGSVIQVLTISEIHVHEENYDADITTPNVHNFDNKQTENSLNQKYIQESKQLYDEFKNEVGNLKKNGEGHYNVDASYDVITDNEKILSIKRTVQKTQASSYETIKFDTIDKQKEMLLTLPILFKDDSYISTISNVIKDQMREQIRNDENKVYWVRGAGINLPPEGVFDQIDANQSFYINENHKLVIAFDDYEVAPGYMGTAEFVIPTEKIANELEGDAYIK
ncbi:DUF3298 and DUF4163 domain-containing protein [Lentibacillus cibarius]|nr:DUF3298 and DUF4163 domain-containing protein [Lentibacillus cibarius]